MKSGNFRALDKGQYASEYGHSNSSFHGAGGFQGPGCSLCAEGPATSFLPYTFPFVRPWPAEEEEENTASAEGFGEKPSLVVSVPLLRSNQVHFAGSERPELWQETKLA